MFVITSSETAEEAEVALEKISTRKNPTDMLTKTLQVAKFKLCLDLLNVRER